MLLPTREQWKEWSLPSKLTAVGTLIGAVALVLSIYFYIAPNQNISSETSADLSQTNRVDTISIPLVIRNELAVEAQINPAVEYYILRPETPATDVQVESGVVRIQRPDGITTINGRYPIPQSSGDPYDIVLPRSDQLSRYLELGGYKLRIAVTNDWVFNYTEVKDVLFDKTTIEDGIRVSMYREKGS